jgi:hypothetical protein
MKEKIKRFLEVSHFYEMAYETIGALASADEIEGLDEATFAQIFDLSEIEDVIIPLYEAKFTEPDIDAILSFFDSSVGQKMLSINTELSDSINSVFNEWISKKYSEYVQ